MNYNNYNHSLSVFHSETGEQEEIEREIIS